MSWTDDVLREKRGDAEKGGEEKEGRNTTRIL